MNPGAHHHLSKGDLDAITSAFRMSAHFQRMRHTRRCERCRGFLTVDNANSVCSPASEPRNQVSE